MRVREHFIYIMIFLLLIRAHTRILYLYILYTSGIRSIIFKMIIF